MGHVVFAAVMRADIFYLGVAIVAGGQHILRAGGHDLIELDLAVSPALFGIAGLERAATASAAVVVGAIGHHVDKIFLTHNAFNNKAHVLGHLLAYGFAHNVARVLTGKLDAQRFVPIRIDLEFALADPLGVKGDDADKFEIVLDVEFFQSFQDCKKGVPSLGIDHLLASQVVVDMDDELFQDITPALLVRQKEAVVLSGPHHRRIGPVSAHQMQDLPQR